LRRDLKDNINNQLLKINGTTRTLNNTNDHEVITEKTINNLKSQMVLMKQERDNSVEMWQNSLLIITKLEQELKRLQFETQPQTMSFDLKLKRQQEEMKEREERLYKEISNLKIEIRESNQSLFNSENKQNELKHKIELLQAELSQKVIFFFFFFV
jgi:phage protein U